MGGAGWHACWSGAWPIKCFAAPRPPCCCIVGQHIRRKEMDDVIVIGAGPAGLAAASYTARHHLKTRVIAPDLAGKAAYRLRLPWMQQPEAIIGEETVDRFREQLLDSPQATRYLDTVERIFRHDDAFQVGTTD